MATDITLQEAAIAVRGSCFHRNPARNASTDTGDARGVWGKDNEREASPLYLRLGPQTMQQLQTLLDSGLTPDVVIPDFHDPHLLRLTTSGRSSVAIAALGKGEDYGSGKRFSVPATVDKNSHFAMSLACDLIAGLVIPIDEAVITVGRIRDQEPSPSGMIAIDLGPRTLEKIAQMQKPKRDVLGPRSERHLAATTDRVRLDLQDYLTRAGAEMAASTPPDNKGGGRGKHASGKGQATLF